MTFQKMKTVAALSMMFVLTLTASPTEAQSSDESLQTRIESVGKLLNHSSAATQVLESDLPVALELRNEALRKYAIALDAHQAGDVKTAEEQLSQVVTLMYSAVGAARLRSAHSEKKDRDFQNRHKSVEALLAAHERIAVEKGLGKEHTELRENISGTLERASELTELGKREEGLKQLDLAYQKVRVSVEQLREGDTLIRQLNFESKQDEYLYELDRNDTHKMLISVLLEDRLQDERVQKRVSEFIAEADDLRQTAESQAENGHYEEAIFTLEQSTGELVKAIRGAGVYIPG